MNKLNMIFTAAAIPAIISVTAHGYSGGANVIFSNGGVSYTSDYSAEKGYDMYAAVYNHGRLEKVIKNAPEGSAEAGTDLRLFYWDTDMKPIRDGESFYMPDGIYVNSAVRPERGAALEINGGEIKAPAGGSAAIKTAETADGGAGEAAKRLFGYLAAVADTGSVLFGHQNDISHKAGAAELSESDIYDVTGDYAAVCGLDTLSLTGDEFSASVCNNKYGTSYAENAEGNVLAAAYLTNRATDNGAIVTLSAHMPNFSIVRKTGAGGKSYAGYDFGGYSPDVLTGNTANEILSGGKYNAVFNAYLDMIADYAAEVRGAVLLRPFHESSGSWFWWGADLCEPSVYKDIYRYTAQYLRDTKNVHNIIYVYSPGGEFNSVSDFEERYPGDEYVDIVGFDMYDRSPDGTDAWLDSLNEKLAVLSDFAKRHGKLAALTETGIANETAEGDRQTALLRGGNADKDWFCRVLDAATENGMAYFMVWSNFAEDNGFYTPYVKWVNGDGTLHGHEMLDNFIDFYNDPRSIFAADQRAVLERLKQRQ